MRTTFTLLRIATIRFLLLLATCRSFTAAELSPIPTFSKDIAAIIFENCASCHRPGQAAPFSLLTYSEVKKHAQDILTVTEKRLMPPWPPEPGYGEFLNERKLTLGQRQRIKQWIENGGPEGRTNDLPQLPKWKDQWRLGTPDLILTMPLPYLVPGEGTDIYRNFVLPIPITTRRYVAAVELLPDNPKVLHHAFVKVDPVRSCRRLDETNGAPGFPGMMLPENAKMPDGQFLTWQPGKNPARTPPGLAWVLEPGSDLVLQTHLRPSGKVEPLRLSVGLYFTDEMPSAKTFKIALASLTLDIPAGQSNYLVRDEYTLPVDASITAVLPHAHYLAREMKASAKLPSGQEIWMLKIDHWDFNWQGDYQYRIPIFLPKGTTLRMEYLYDNSVANPSNPNHPPKRVFYGPQSSDEMAELWFQLVVPNLSELSILEKDYTEKTKGLLLARSEAVLARDPDNAPSHCDLGLMLMGKKDVKGALTHFQAALRADKNYARAHYLTGVASRILNRTNDAKREFIRCIELDPSFETAYGNLGLVYLQEGNFDQASIYLQKALTLDDSDYLAHDGLGVIAAQKGSLREAFDHIKKAASLAPGDREIQQHLQTLSQALRQ